MTTTWDRLDHDPTSIAADQSTTTLAELAEDDFYTDHAIEVDQRRIPMTTALNIALAALDQASTALAALTSNPVYDVEFAEGHDGADVAKFLDDSLRYTRAAYAIAHAITSRG
jgi:hypothetical protein